MHWGPIWLLTEFTVKVELNQIQPAFSYFGQFDKDMNDGQTGSWAVYTVQLLKQAWWHWSSGGNDFKQVLQSKPVMYERTSLHSPYLKLAKY